MSKGLKPIHQRIAIGGVTLLAGLAWLYATNFFSVRR